MLQYTQAPLLQHTHSLPEGWQRILVGYAKEILKLNFETEAWIKLHRRTRRDGDDSMRYSRLIGQGVNRLIDLLHAGEDMVNQVNAALAQQTQEEEQGGDSGGEGENSGDGDDAISQQEQQEVAEGGSQ